MKKVFSVFAWIISFQVIGFLIGTLTASNIPNWYDALHKSSLTPPGFVFSIVWGVLYALLAIMSWMIWENSNERITTTSKYLFFLQLMMNWAWTPLFFSYHLIGLSFLWILVMIIINLFFILRMRYEKPILSLLSLPYNFWLMFAAYLNGVIWISN